VESKEELLKRLGKNDGNNETRWLLAVDMCGRLDRHVNFCFESVIKLEDNGLIELNMNKNEITKVFKESYLNLSLEESLKKRFASTITHIFKNEHDFIAQYDRLNNTNISKKLTPVENMIDEASGKRDEELKGFFACVRQTVFEPMIKDEMLSL